MDKMQSEETTNPNDDAGLMKEKMAHKNCDRREDYATKKEEMSESKSHERMEGE